MCAAQHARSMGRCDVSVSSLELTIHEAAEGGYSVEVQISEDWVARLVGGEDVETCDGLDGINLRPALAVPTPSLSINLHRAADRHPHGDVHISRDLLDQLVAGEDIEVLDGVDGVILRLSLDDTELPIGKARLVRRSES